MDPPVAIVDPYHWLRDDTRTKPSILSHLEKENEYTSYVTAPLQRSIDKLYKELLSRLKETDTDVPYRWNNWYYYTRTEKGKSYTFHCRASSLPPPLPSSPSTTNSSPSNINEIIYLDENILATGLEFCDVHGAVPSPDHSLIAYTVDTNGYETYDVRFKTAESSTQAIQELQKGLCSSSVTDVLEGSNGDVRWGGNNSTVYYLKMDPAHRPYQLWKHTMGTLQNNDVCLFTENDERYWMGISKSSTDDFLIMETSSKTTSEIYFIPLTERGVTAFQPSTRDKTDINAVTSLVTKEPLAIGSLIPITPRTEGVLYEVEHYRTPASSTTGSDIPSDILLILSNRDKAINFKVSVCYPYHCQNPNLYQDILPHNPDIYITGLDVFEQYWVFFGRKDGYTNIWISRAEEGLASFLSLFRNRSTNTALNKGTSPPQPRFPMYSLPVWDAVYTIYGIHRANREYALDNYRFGYSSPTTPTRTCEFSMTVIPRTTVSTIDSQCAEGFTIQTSDFKGITILKEKEVPNCDPTQYATKRIWATANDGTRIPVSLVYRPSVHGITTTIPAANDDSVAITTDEPTTTDQCPFSNGPAPLLLYGYGSYGHSIDLHFSSTVLSLADRGVVYAVAHVRGGSEMGRHWYETEGKLLKKKNTFTDFINVAEYLIQTGWTIQGGIVANGASAGGLLMGVILNTRPELWGGIVSDVGFVDVIQSVADPSIPLAVTEWEEWGNPNEATYFDYISSYSPLDNVAPPRPHDYLTSSKNGSAISCPSLSFLTNIVSSSSSATTLVPSSSPSTPVLPPRHYLPPVVRPSYPYPFPPVLLTAGLNDSRVAYWEATKYAARLRDAASVAGFQPRKNIASLIPPNTVVTEQQKDGLITALRQQLDDSAMDTDDNTFPSSSDSNNNFVSTPSSMFTPSGTLRTQKNCTFTHQPGSNIFLKIDMGAGHFSYADRYVYLREKALEYAWIFDCLGVPV